MISCPYFSMLSTLSISKKHCVFASFDFLILVWCLRMMVFVIRKKLLHLILMAVWSIHLWKGTAFNRNALGIWCEECFFLFKFWIPQIIDLFSIANVAWELFMRNNIRITLPTLQGYFKFEEYVLFNVTSFTCALLNFPYGVNQFNSMGC